jgi:hypothetical protein
MIDGVKKTQLHARHPVRGATKENKTREREENTASRKTMLHRLRNTDFYSQYCENLWKLRQNCSPRTLREEA